MYEKNNWQSHSKRERHSHLQNIDRRLKIEVQIIEGIRELRYKIWTRRASREELTWKKDTKTHQQGVLTARPWRELEELTELKKLQIIEEPSQKDQVRRCELKSSVNWSAIDQRAVEKQHKA